MTANTVSSGRVTFKRPRSASTKFPHARRFSYETPQRLKELEQGFVLDGVTLSKQANDEIDRTQPSLNLGVPQYNAVNDPHCKTYFKSKGLPQLVTANVKNTDENNDLQTSMLGKVFDRFVRNSSARQYLQEREDLGAGYTRRLYGGHLSVPTVPLVTGYHGTEGYRRNTFDLRQKRSVFDYEDPFENPKPINRRVRTQSAPATMRLLRQKSATVYRAHPGGRRAISAMPRPMVTPIHRELATGPVP